MLGKFRSSFLLWIPFLLQVIQIVFCVDSQLGYKSYAIISLCYLRLDLAVSNNKPQQITTLERWEVVSFLNTKWWNEVPSWCSGCVSHCSQGLGFFHLFTLSSQLCSVLLLLLLFLSSYPHPFFFLSSVSLSFFLFHPAS